MPSQTNTSQNQRPQIEEKIQNGLDYFVLDVFTTTPLSGNPLAVVLNPGTLTKSEMQSIAREMNLSETTFIERRDAAVERREGIRVRIFTTQEELPFAGHPTLGTSSLLRAIAPECVTNNEITLALNVGPVLVRFEPHAHSNGQLSELWPAYGEMTQRDPEFGQLLDPAEVATLTGLEVEDFDPAVPIQIVSTGTAFAIVPLRSADALSRMRVRQEEASALLIVKGARWFYLLGPVIPEVANLTTSAQPQWRARMQFNGGEDPATGSAAGCAISHLVRHAAVPPGAAIHLRQGVEMNRPSDLFLRADLEPENEQSEIARVSKIGTEAARISRVTNVRVAGSTVLVAKGRLFLP